MKLNFAHFCDFAVVDNANRLSLFGIFDSIAFKIFPATHPLMFFVANVSFDDVGTHKLEIKFIAPEDKPDFAKPFSQDVLINDKQAIVVFLRMNSVANLFQGRYIARVSVDGKEIGDASFEVKLSNDAN